MEDVRTNLDRLCRERRVEYQLLSKLLNRNSAYIQQFIKRGSPRKLDEDDRRTLAEFFGVSEEVLGGRPGGAVTYTKVPKSNTALVIVPKLEVGASAGAGSLTDDGPAVAQFGFGEKWLKSMKVHSDLVSIVQVDGDSMSPTLLHGDDILVDRSQTEHLRDGIYVLRFADTLMVKRIALNPMAKLISVRSDNPTYPDWEDCDPEQVQIIGKVVWVGRKI
jgi:phage repressor protein C with HTH and peptisase S24 domain